MQGDRHVLILHTDQLREFVGLPPSEAGTSYRELAGATNRVLEAVERAVRQVPSDRLSDPTPNRGRDLRELVFNIHDHIAGLNDALDTGTYPWEHGDDRAASRRFTTTEELAQYCRDARVKRYEGASSVDSHLAEEVVETRRGFVTHLQLLESRAFHSAQHQRQIYVFLRQIGIEPDHELTAEEMRPIVLGEQVF